MKEERAERSDLIFSAPPAFMTSVGKSRETGGPSRGPCSVWFWGHLAWTVRQFSQAPSLELSLVTLPFNEMRGLIVQIILIEILAAVPFLFPFATPPLSHSLLVLSSEAETETFLSDFDNVPDTHSSIALFQMQGWINLLPIAIPHPPTFTLA